MATAEICRPSLAKVCVQIDLLIKLPFRVWMECDGSLSGYWQSIEYDKLPHYCRSCVRLGHDMHACKMGQQPSIPNRIPQKVYRPKQTQNTQGQKTNPIIPLLAQIPQSQIILQMILQHQLRLKTRSLQILLQILIWSSASSHKSKPKSCFTFFISEFSSSIYFKTLN